MTPPEKPEWIEIADNDNAASVRRVSKKLPILAIVAVATVIGVGALFGQTQEESPASAVETIAPTVQATQASQTSSPASEAPAVKKSAPVPRSSVTQSAAEQASATPTATTAPKKPSIGTLPTSNGDDGEHDGGEGEHDGGEGDD